MDKTWLPRKVGVPCGFHGTSFSVLFCMGWMCIGECGIIAISKVFSEDLQKIYHAETIIKKRNKIYTNRVENFQFYVRKSVTFSTISFEKTTQFV